MAELVVFIVSVARKFVSCAAYERRKHEPGIIYGKHDGFTSKTIGVTLELIYNRPPVKAVVSTARRNANQ